MRITYIHQHFCLPAESGGQRPWEFARRLVQRGHQVTVIAGHQDAQELFLEGVRIVRLKAAYSNQMSFPSRVRSFLSFMGRATLAALRLQADVVFASSTPLTTAVPGIVASYFRRVPFVFEVRDLWPSVPARLGYLKAPALIRSAQLVEAHAYRRASRVIALSPSMREGVLQTAPLADVRLIPNAADIDLFSRPKADVAETRSGLGWSRPVAFYAGSFGETYRIPWMVRLAAAAPEIEFQIVGEGKATDEARRLANELGLDADRLLPGRIPKGEVARRMAACDIALSSICNHPALQGNSLNKVFDALAAGRPVAFNHDGWLSEMLVMHGAGWRLDDDPEIAGRQLSEVVMHESLLKAAAQASAGLARRFDREVLFEDFEQALTFEPARLP